MALPKRGEAPSSNAVFLFHLFSFILFLYALLWHFGSTAATMSHFHSFGWFFKFLTFCGFFFQTIGLAICVLSHLFPEVKSIRRITDDIACACFPIANTVTVMHWGLYFFISNSLEETTSSNPVPVWLDLTMHLINAVVAWVDVCTSERTFRKSSLHFALFFAFSYILWMQICASKNKVYPYPFLNKFREPEGVIVTSIIGLSIVALFFTLGAKLPNVETSRRLKKLKGV